MPQAVDPSRYLDRLIESRNRTIWEALMSRYHCEIIESIESNCCLTIYPDRLIIGVVPAKLTSASFTHELLHAYTFLDKVSVGIEFRYRWRGDRVMQSVMTPELFDHLGNVLEHVKMLPVFLSLGYKRNEFLDRYRNAKVEPAMRRYIRNKYFFHGQVNGNAVDRFIGSFFAAACDPNPNRQYRRTFAVLQSVDPELFRILSTAMKTWTSIDIADSQVGERCATMVQTFIESLHFWARDKDIRPCS